MIIGIDVSSIQYGTGVGNYTLNLVKNLIKIDSKNFYKLFFSSLRQPLPTNIKKLEKFKNVKIYHYRLPTTLVEIIFNRLRLFPIEFFIGKCHLFHTSDWTQPPTRSAKTITTVHDLTPLLFPKWHHPPIVKTHQRKLSLASKHCHSFISVSQNTKNDLQTLFPQINPKKIHLIYEAAAAKYKNFNKLNPSEKTTIKKQIKNKYQLSDYILAQGTREPRKNLNRLIKAFILFKRQNPKSDVQLAITGKYGWGQDINSKQPSSIKILGFVPESDLLPLHAAATALVYPSLYEGFGLPIIKSLNLGVPVITSNTSSMPEVAGPAALYVNPKSTQSIYLAIKKIINSPNTRHQLSRLGRLQAKKFSWTKTAQQTLKVYQQIYNKP